MQNENSKINFKKNYGQNFIFDHNLLCAIVSDSEVENQNVLEIGTGAGTLTKEISKVATKVLTYEIDKELQSNITSNLLDCNNVEVVFKDIMQEDLVNIESKLGTNYVVVANIPYYITTPIIFKFLKATHRPQKMILMVQKEVAQRICSNENEGDYGALSVTINAVSTTKILRIVKKNMFVPSPKVDSAIIEIRFSNVYDIVNVDTFFRLVKCVFTARRKTLANNLKVGFGFGQEQIGCICNTLHIDSRIRGEQLSVQQFVILSNQINSTL